MTLAVHPEHNELVRKLLALTPTIKDFSLSVADMHHAGACWDACQKAQRYLKIEDDDQLFKASEWIASGAFRNAFVDWLVYGGEDVITPKRQRWLARVHLNLHFLRLEEVGVTLDEAFKTRLLRRLSLDTTRSELTCPVTPEDFGGVHYAAAITVANLCEKDVDPLFRIKTPGANDEIIRAVLLDRLQP